VATGGPGGTVAAENFALRPDNGIGGWNVSVNIEPGADIIAFARSVAIDSYGNNGMTNSPYMSFNAGHYVSPTFDVSVSASINP
jgi:hypothetical protein